MSGFAPIQTFRKQDPAGSPFTPGSAANGASIDSLGRVVLGNEVGEPGAPGQLLTDREILMDLAGSIFFSNSGIPQFSEIRPGILGVFSNADISETSLVPGRIQVTRFPTQDAIIFMGGNQPNEMQIEWQGPANFMRFGDAVNNNWLTFFGAAGNVVIGPGTLADNGNKLQVDGHISMRTATATLDFPSTNAGESSDLTIALADAAVGDIVVLGVPAGSVDPNSCFTAFVDSAGSVTVRFNNYQLLAAIDPNPGDFTVSIFKPL